MMFHFRTAPSSELNYYGKEFARRHHTIAGIQKRYGKLEFKIAAAGVH
jgi:hypothetical protein